MATPIPISDTIIVNIDSINKNIIFQIPNSASATVGEYEILVIGTLPNGVSSSFKFQLIISEGSETPLC